MLDSGRFVCLVLDHTSCTPPPPGRKDKLAGSITVYQFHSTSILRLILSICNSVYSFFFSSRENANLEYLKNVILRYLLTDSESVRQQMVAAIATILEFSPQEVIKAQLFTIDVPASVEIGINTTIQSTLIRCGCSPFRQGQNH